MDSNDNWQDHAASADIRVDLKPSRMSESVILTTLDPGAYTAIVRGTSETTGIGIIGTVDDVLIGGVIISGETAKTVWNQVPIRRLLEGLMKQLVRVS
jgi:hypothetical protein